MTVAISKRWQLEYFISGTRSQILWDSTLRMDNFLQIAVLLIVALAVLQSTIVFYYVPYWPRNDPLIRMLMTITIASFEPVL